MSLRPREAAAGWQVFFYIHPCFFSPPQALISSPDPPTQAQLVVYKADSAAAVNRQPLSPPAPRAGMTEGSRQEIECGLLILPLAAVQASAQIWPWGDPPPLLPAMHRLPEKAPGPPPAPPPLAHGRGQNGFYLLLMPPVLLLSSGPLTFPLLTVCKSNSKHLWEVGLLRILRSGLGFCLPNAVCVSYLLPW